MPQGTIIGEKIPYKKALEAEQRSLAVAAHGCRPSMCQDCPRTGCENKPKKKTHSTGGSPPAEPKKSTTADYCKF